MFSLIFYWIVLSSGLCGHLTANICTCPTRKSTGVNNNVNYGSVLLKWLSKPRQGAIMDSIGTPNWSSHHSFLLFTPFVLSHVKMSSTDWHLANLLKWDESHVTILIRIWTLALSTGRISNHRWKHTHSHAAVFQLFTGLGPVQTQTDLRTRQPE